MTRRTARGLGGLSAGIVALALGRQIAPLRLRLPVVREVGLTPNAATADPSERAAALLSYEEIVRSDPFDVSRQPPSERYVPPELRASQASDSAPRRPVAPRLQLFGVATGPTGAVALIDANPSIPGAEIYRTGDRVSVYRLESISDTAVVLRGETGVRTLRLESLTGRSR